MTNAAVTRSAMRPSYSGLSRGSALVESILLVSVMSFFLVGIPALGKLVDLSQTAVQASRYGAWEKTIAKNPISNTPFVQERFFRDAAAPISSSVTSADPHYLWGSMQSNKAGNVQYSRSGGINGKRAEAGVLVPHLYGSDNRLVVLDSGITTSNSMVTHPAHGKVGIGVGNSVRQAARAIGGSGWDLQANGLISASVTVNVEQNALFDQSATGCPGGSGSTFGCIQESSTILVDGWSAGSDDSAKRRVKSFVPTSRIEKVGDVVAKLGNIPLLKELEGLKDAFGCVQTDVLPGKTSGDGVVLSRYRASGCRKR